MKKVENIKYSDCDDCILDIYLPQTDVFSVLIYFHGGGFEGGDKTEADVLASYLTVKNIAVVSANYRMYPKAKYPDFFCDAAAAVAWTKKNISEYGKCDKFYVGGSSAGGYISMLLCFDKKYLAPYGIKPTDIDGYIHNAGQPTVHFNILRERGIDTRRVIVDESAPLYHIGREAEYPPMLFIVADNDMENRYEQTMLVLSTMKHFRYSDYDLEIIHGGHCDYVAKRDENGDSVLGKLIYSQLEKWEKR